VRANGAVRQRELAGGRGLSGVIGRLSSMFTGPVPR
jgi:hypothetical protein